MPCVDLAVELQDLSFELAEQHTQGFETRTRDLGNALVLMIGDGIEQVLHTVASDRRDNAELRQMGAYGVDDRSLLPDEEVPRTMKHQAALLLGRFGRHEAHAGPLHCLTDGLSIGSIILLAFDIGLHVGRRDQPHDMPESLQLARPMMRGGAGFDADQAGRQLLEERQHVPALQLSADYDAALRVDPVNLEDGLCDVEADCCDCQHNELLRILVASSATDSKALPRPVGGAVHSIRSRLPPIRRIKSKDHQAGARQPPNIGV